MSGQFLSRDPAALFSQHQDTCFQACEASSATVVTKATIIFWHCCITKHDSPSEGRKYRSMGPRTDHDQRACKLYSAHKRDRQARSCSTTGSHDQSVPKIVSVGPGWIRKIILLRKQWLAYPQGREQC